VDRPNILVIMTDQQRRDTLGAYGCDWISTPNLDRLAAEGTLFTRASVDNPVCTPSRASIFTGKPVFEHTVLRVHDNLPDDEMQFPERLRRDGGYRTALFGKLHTSSRVKEEVQRHPNDGFEIYEWCLEPSVSMDSRFNGYVPWLRETAPDFLAALKQNGRRELHHPEDLHMSKWAADRTIAFIEAAKSDGRPFFCLMSLFDPHDPYEDHPRVARAWVDAERIPAPIAKSDAPDCVRREQQASYLGRADAFTPDDIGEIRLGYGASIAFVDRQVGRVLDALDGAGLAGETLVVFLSDHGDQLGDHGLFVKGVGLYEPTVGVPLLLRWPGHVAEGGRCDGLAQGRDLAATCLAAAGLDHSDIPSSEDLVGMAEAGRARRSVAATLYRNSGINNEGEFWNPPMLSTMVRDERYKLVVYGSGGRSERELFDLADNPQETRNLAGAPGHAATEARLLAELAALMHTEAAQLRPRAAPSLPKGRQRLKNALK